MYENFVGTWETVRNRGVSVLERCPHGEVRLYFHFISLISHSELTYSTLGVTGAVFKIAGEMRWLLAYFDNPVCKLDQ